MLCIWHTHAHALMSHDAYAYVHTHISILIIFADFFRARGGSLSGGAGEDIIVYVCEDNDAEQRRHKQDILQA